MKILVIQLENTNPSVLLEEDHLVNLHYLMNMGCWGTLEANSNASWGPLADRLTAAANGDYSRVIIRRVTDQRDSYADLDTRIGSQLESIVDDTIVLVVCLNADSASGSFVLAAPNSPLNGRLDGVRVADIAATLLVLAGFPPLPGSQGVPLAEPVEPGSQTDDEEMIRERLRGLGYIA